MTSKLSSGWKWAQNIVIILVLLVLPLAAPLLRLPPCFTRRIASVVKFAHLTPCELPFVSRTVRSREAVPAFHLANSNIWLPLKVEHRRFVKVCLPELRFGVIEELLKHWLVELNLILVFRSQQRERGTDEQQPSLSRKTKITPVMFKAVLSGGNQSQVRAIFKAPDLIGTQFKSDSVKC